MKRLLGLLLAVLMLAGCAAPAAAPAATGAATPALTAAPTPVPTPTATPVPNYDFRNVSWGMTRNDVIASEGKEPSSTDAEGDYFSGITVMGFPATVAYTYGNDKVISGFYMFDQKHTNDTDFVSDYKTLKEGIVSKYGKPADDRETWKDDLYKDSPSEYGMAVATGRLVYYSQWKTETTEIVMMLSGDNFDISLFIRYQDIKAPEKTPDSSGL